MREQFFNCSIEVFQSKGYVGTTITDIVKAASIARRTFYKYFRGKEELFLECLNEVFLRWSREEPRDDQVLSESAYRSRLNKIFVVGYKAYPRWISMLNLLRAVAAKDPKKFQGKLQSALEVRMKPIVDDVRTAISRTAFAVSPVAFLTLCQAGILETSPAGAIMWKMTD